MRAGRVDGPLTVDVDVAADVGAAQRVGDLAGDRFREEGVVHNDLICVSRDLLDYTSSFCPPGDKKTDAEKRRGVIPQWREKKS